MPNVATVLASRSGLVEAPAGCGKTQLIVETLATPSDRPTLVLTHTSAGVAALRARLQSRGVSRERYRVSTMDSWVMQLISCYPQRAGYIANPENIDYSATRAAATRLCQSGAISTILSSSYDRVLVDEYQDCSVSQHAIVMALANILPIVVFGDPLQAIFGFGGDPLPNWQRDILTFFPHLGTLTTPWRWNNVGAGPLGAWLLQVRQALLNGQSIDLRSCPGFVEWLQPPQNPAELIQAQVNVQFSVNRNFPEDNILIIGDSINADTRHSYASRAAGVNVVETVELRDTLDHVRNMSGQRGRPLLEAAIGFLRRVMVNVYGDQLLTRVQSILNERNRTPPTAQELAAVRLSQNGGYSEALIFMQAMNQDRQRRIYRDVPFRMVIDALTRVSIDTNLDLVDVFISMREQRRHAGRSITGRSVGSTLLLKGLEADHVIILDADNPERGRRMNAANLYVALSRGAKSIKIFSRNPVIPVI